MPSIKKHSPHYRSFKVLTKTNIIVCSLLIASCQSISQENISKSNQLENTQTQYITPSDTKHKLTSNNKKSLKEDIKNENIWLELKNDFELTEYYSVHKSIQIEEDILLKNKTNIHNSLEASTPFIFYIKQQLKDNNLPAELALLPIIESTYNPFAKSHANALGLWQFIPIAAKQYNLERTSFYDARQDLFRSTDAAINYLIYLNEMFEGDWLLTLAAYNAGEGTVQRAINQNKQKNFKTDFWNLNLPQETQKYVPKILALSKIIYNTELSSDFIPRINNKPFFEKINIPKGIELQSIANLDKSISYEILSTLNAGFKRGIVFDGPNSILIPVESVEKITTKIDTLPTDKYLAKYEVLSGDSLSKIAYQHKVKISDIKRTNNLESNLLKINQIILIPGSTVSKNPPDSEFRYYTVKSGDNLSTIAKNNQITLAQIKKWNPIIRSSTIIPGQKIRIKRVS